MTYRVLAWVIRIAVYAIIGTCIAVNILWPLYLAMTVQIPAW